MQIPFLAWLFQGIPESIAVATFVFSMSVMVFSWGNVIKVGLIQAVVIYVIRLMPFTPGVHVLILITSLALVSMLIGNIEFQKSAVYSALTISFLVIFEFVFFSLLGGQVSFEDMEGNVWLRIICTTPQVVVIFLLAYIVRLKKLNKKFDRIFRIQRV